MNAHRSSRLLRTVSLGTVAAVTVVGLAACGSSSSYNSTTAATTTATTTAAATGPTIKTTLNEFKIVTAPAMATAGRVVFDVTNTGKVEHEFAVIKTTKPANAALNKQNPDADVPGNVGEIASIQPGASKQLVIKKLAAGHYALVCALPGHYESGMYSEFTVN